MTWTNESIASALASKANLVGVKDADGTLPNRPGLYSIFVDVADSLPAPFADYLRERSTRLLYIDVAKISLVSRLLQQELQHQSPATFFRGIGAVLGFRPPIASLAKRKNKNNYQFSQPDTQWIIAWSLAHLSIRYVEIDPNQLKDAEKYAIRTLCPLFNTMHNPQPRLELAMLRQECRDIARRVQN